MFWSDCRLLFPLTDVRLRFPVRGAANAPVPEQGGETPGPTPHRATSRPPVLLVPVLVLVGLATGGRKWQRPTALTIGRVHKYSVWRCVAERGGCLHLVRTHFESAASASSAIPAWVGCMESIAHALRMTHASAFSAKLARAQPLIRYVSDRGPRRQHLSPVQLIQRPPAVAEKSARTF